MRLPWPAMAAVTLAVVVALAALRHGGARAGAHFAEHRLGRGVTVLAGGGANTTIVQRAGETLVVDAKDPESGAALVAALAERRADRPRHLVLTHAHAAATGGLGAFPDTVSVVCQRETDRALRAAGDRGGDVILDRSLTLHVGDETVHVQAVGPAHTAGDVVAFLEHAGVLITGDLVTPDHHPVLLAEQGARALRWLRALKYLRNRYADPDLRVVPGLGDPGGRELLDAEIAYFDSLVELAETGLERGWNEQELLRAAEPLRQRLRERRGHRLDANLLRVHAELQQR